MSKSALAASGKPVWDPMIRIFHWLLVALIAFSWWSGEQHDMERHRLSGYAILALLIFRIYWGFVGSKTARFSSFVRGPKGVLAYLSGSANKPYAPEDGHNPLGGLSVIAMLAIISLMVIAGLFASDIDGIESGPLATFISFEQSEQAGSIHKAIFNGILALVALHIGAVLFYLFIKRQNLIAAMFTGCSASKESVETAKGSSLPWSPVRALIGIVIAMLITWTVANGFSL